MSAIKGLTKGKTVHLDGSLENPEKGAEGVSRWKNICESLRQKDSEV